MESESIGNRKRFENVVHLNGVRVGTSAFRLQYGVYGVMVAQWVVVPSETDRNRLFLPYRNDEMVDMLRLERNVRKYVGVRVSLSVPKDSGVMVAQESPKLLAIVQFYSILYMLE